MSEPCTKHTAVQAAPLTGLAPVVNANTVLLVLGSFPGATSLQTRQYCAHAQNQFWPLLQALWPQHPMPERSDYAGRCDWLLARRLGLWDVYGACERRGSLDADIRHAQLNDFAGLRRRCPLLVASGHNGGHGFKHARLVVALELVVHALPSTSAVHAAWSFERKLGAWAPVMVAHGLL